LPEQFARRVVVGLALGCPLAWEELAKHDNGLTPNQVFS
jgi:hypothetical protein